MEPIAEQGRALRSCAKRATRAAICEHPPPPHRRPHARYYHPLHYHYRLCHYRHHHQQKFTVVRRSTGLLFLAAWASLDLLIYPEHLSIFCHR